MEEFSYFPIVIKYQDDGEEVAILSPDEIEDGRSFEVISTQEKRA